MRVLKIYCPECGEVAIIKKTARKHPHLADLYCSCNDVECGHTFVMNMTFSHTISPSAKTQDKIVADLLSVLNPSQRQLVLELLQTAG